MPSAAQWLTIGLGTMAPKTSKRSLRKMLFRRRAGVTARRVALWPRQGTSSRRARRCCSPSPRPHGPPRQMFGSQGPRLHSPPRQMSGSPCPCMHQRCPFAAPMPRTHMLCPVLPMLCSHKIAILALFTKTTATTTTTTTPHTPHPRTRQVPEGSYVHRAHDKKDEDRTARPSLWVGGSVQCQACGEIALILRRFLTPVLAPGSGKR